MDQVLECVARQLQAFQRATGANQYCVGFSGGLDSTVLLHAMKALSVEDGGNLRAIHINHGLSADSQQWSDWCAAICDGLQIDFQVTRVHLAPRPRQSMEAEARRQRYQAMAESLLPDEGLVLAHHLGDQAETVLLQLLRGAGPRGLAAMPWLSPLGRGWKLRPMLGLTRKQILQWAEDRKLSWVDDPSNQDEAMDRNFIRSRLMPLLENRWPGGSKALNRTARLCAETSDLLDELAGEDARKLADGRRIQISGLQALGPARARNLLRFAIRSQGLPVPPERQLRSGLSDLLQAGPDRQPDVSWAGGGLSRYRGWIYILPRGRHEYDCEAPEQTWFPPGAIQLGCVAGTLRGIEASGAGLSAAVAQGGLRVGFRQGGERIRPAGHAHSRKLKQLFQEAGVVPWMRRTTPLLWSGEELAAVGDLWIADWAKAKPGKPGVQIVWENHEALE